METGLHESFEVECSCCYKVKQITMCLKEDFEAICNECIKEKGLTWNKDLHFIADTWNK